MLAHQQEMRSREQRMYFITMVERQIGVQQQKNLVPLNGCAVAKNKTGLIKKQGATKSTEYTHLTT